MYRRHSERCKYSKTDNPQEYTKCNCPIYVYGAVNGREIRKSLKMRNWKRATAKVEEMNRHPHDAVPAITVSDAVESFLAHRGRKGKAESTIDSHRNAFVHLVAMYGGKPISSITVDMLDKLQESRTFQPPKKGEPRRPVQASTLNKELKSLRALFSFAVTRKWCSENPAKSVDMADEDNLPTLPFSDDEVARIIEACDRLEDTNPHTRELNRAKAKARVLLLLYTGFRISDTIQLLRSRVDLQTGQVLVTMMKTQHPLYLRLHPDAVAALRALPETGKYFLWSGNSTMHTAASNARKSIARVCALAGVEDGHPHRFRDTFAIHLLRGGASLHTVQLLLGHKTIRTTEKHYAPFVLEYQQVVDSATSKLSFTARTKNRTIEKGDAKRQQNRE